MKINNQQINPGAIVLREAIDIEYTLETNRLILRPFKLEDAQMVQELCGDIEVARTTLLIPFPYPSGAAESWIISNQAAAVYDARFAFALVNKADQNLLGCMTLSIDKLHKRGELAYWIGRSFWGLGFATEAAKSVVSFGFNTIRLNKIWAAAMTKNPASSQVMCKVGMKYEGTLRQHVLKWDIFEDLDFYGILKIDYAKINHQNSKISISDENLY
ncbi:MAG: acetyltransferase [Bacilli bacterium]|nr:acetyltransferase [Bacilli bacterium]